MKSYRLIPGVLALAAVLSPLAGRADHTCGSNIVIFSYPLSVNANVAECEIDPSDDVDGRLINPGSTSISLRYTVDIGADVPFIFANVDGLGFVNKSVKLTRTLNDISGTYAYDSATMSIPGGRTTMGCVTASIVVGEFEGEPIIESNSFHTIDSSCPA